MPSGVIRDAQELACCVLRATSYGQKQNQLALYPGNLGTWSYKRGMTWEMKGCRSLLHWEMGQEVTGGRWEENSWWLEQGEDIAAAAGLG